MSRGEKSVSPSGVPARWTRFLGLLIGAMCAVEAAIWGGGVLLGSAPGVRGVVLEYAAFWPGLLRDWRPNYALQPWTMFVSYGFLHGGLVHLAVNMLALWSLGLRVIERAGPAGFAVIYGVSLVGGAVAFGLLAADLRPMVGASGALFGLAGAVLAWEYLDRSAGALSLWPVARAVTLIAGLNLALWWAMQGLLAWQTHLGGFVAGGVVAMLMDRFGRAR